MRRIRLVGGLASGSAALALLAAPAGAAVPHTVMPGETLWSIAAANNFTTASVAAYNGLAADAQVYVGETIQIPTEDEGAAALASAGSPSASSPPAGGGSAHTVASGESLWSIASAAGVSEPSLAAANGLSPDALLIAGQTIQIPAGATPVTASAPTTTSSSGISLAPIWSPSGTDYLRSDAAAAWNQMRQASLSQYGVDLYPGGPLSAYRTYDQQAELYREYLDGTGAPANPPGTSSHELGTAVDVATPEMRSIVDAIGAAYGWGKVHGPGEWWHVDYLG
jgi:LysM repeat protein